MAKVKAVWSGWRIAEAFTEGAVAPVWEPPKAGRAPIAGLPGAGREWIREGTGRR
jgi:hypothetical protein